MTSTESLASESINLLEGLQDLPEEDRLPRLRAALTSVMLEAQAKAVTDYRQAMLLVVALKGFHATESGKFEASDALEGIYQALNADVYETHLRAAAKEVRDDV